MHALLLLAALAAAPITQPQATPPAAVTIRAEHPRLTDLPALREKFAAPEYAGWQAALAKESAKGDALAAALLGTLGGDAAQKQAAITRVTTRTAKPANWSQRILAVQVVLAADLLMDDMTPAQRAEAWTWVRDMFQANADLSQKGSSDWTDLRYFWNEPHQKRICFWLALLTFHKTGVDDARIAAKIAQYPAGTSGWFTPWECANTLYLLSGEEGGRPVGVQTSLVGWSGGYAGYFAAMPPWMFEGHRVATGEDLRPINTFLTKAGRNYYAGARTAKIAGGATRAAWLATGQASGDDAALSRWLGERAGKIVGTEMLVLGDLRVKAKSPQQCGLPLGGHEPGADLWFSRSGYDNATSDRVLLTTEHLASVGRVESPPCFLSVFSGTEPIVISEEENKVWFHAGIASGHWISAIDGSGYTTDRAKGFGLGSPTACFAKPAKVFLGQPVWTGEGPGWRACTVDAVTYPPACGGVKRARRTVVHLIAERVVVVRDWIILAKPGSRHVGITWRTASEPTSLDPVRRTWTYGGAKFTVLSPVERISWTGGLGQEIIDPFSGKWIGKSRDGYVPGYSSDPKKATIGVGQVLVVPLQIQAPVVTVIDLASQYGEHPHAGDLSIVAGRRILFSGPHLADGALEVQ